MTLKQNTLTHLLLLAGCLCPVRRQHQPRRDVFGGTMWAKTWKKIQRFLFSIHVAIVVKWTLASNDQAYPHQLPKHWPSPVQILWSPKTTNHCTDKAFQYQTYPASLVAYIHRTRCRSMAIIQTQWSKYKTRDNNVPENIGKNVRKC